jgi:hypothetical protein
VRRLAIDPGDVHVGYAHNCFGTFETGEWTPRQCTEEVVHLMTLDVVDELIVEEFVLYEWETQKQAWSDLKTPQLIGGLKLIASWFRIPVEMQSATIKRPTRRQLQARGIMVQLRSGGHAADAQLHYWYRTIRRAKEESSG